MPLYQCCSFAIIRHWWIVRYTKRMKAIGIPYISLLQCTFRNCPQIEHFCNTLLKITVWISWIHSKISWITVLCYGLARLAVQYHRSPCFAMEWPIQQYNIEDHHAFKWIKWISATDWLLSSTISWIAMICYGLDQLPVQYERSLCFAMDWPI